ncbi:hypothetical protein ACIRA2_25165, partial [Streptomyces griseoviridis]
TWRTSGTNASTPRRSSPVRNGCGRGSPRDTSSSHLAHKRDERVDTAKILAGEERLRAWLSA